MTKVGTELHREAPEPTTPQPAHLEPPLVGTPVQPLAKGPRGVTDPDVRDADKRSNATAPSNLQGWDRGSAGSSRDASFRLHLEQIQPWTPGSGTANNGSERRAGTTSLEKRTSTTVIIATSLNVPVAFVARKTERKVAPSLS